MCPVCIATAVLIAGGVASGGGLTALAMKKSRRTSAIDNRSAGTRGETLDAASGAAPERSP